ncbi:MAG: 1-phosphofructokinase [Christensenellaceae bacterium]|nr:1-phosphofructokinase [Christensenellaceae bacterium]
MIITLTLNTALDKTLVMDELHVGKVNRVKSIRRDAGGKGLLVSKTLSALGSESVALGIVGGSIGHFILSQLDELGIANDLVEVNMETRTNLKIIDNKNGTYTEINEPGALLHNMVIEEVFYTLQSHVRQGDSVVLAGSLPEGCREDIYADMISHCKAEGAKVYLDTEGEPLRLGIARKPFMIKPNKFELASLCSCDPEDDIALLAEAKRLVSTGIEYVLLSLGALGAIFVSKDFTLRARGLSVPVVGRSGAGDAMTAAMVMSMEKGLSPEECLRFAVASASAKIMVAGTQPPEIETVEELLPKVVITDMKGL